MTTSTTDFRNVLDAFEKAWQEASQPRLADFVPAADHPRGRELLRELVKMDVEHRIRAGDPPPLCGGYSTLGYPGSPQEKTELIALEYQWRWENGDRSVRAHHYVGWFRDLEHALASLRPLWNCPACKSKKNVLEDEEATSATCPRCQQVFPVSQLFSREPTVSAADTPSTAELESDPYKTAAPDSGRETPKDSSSRKIRCPHCQNPIQIAKESDEVLCPGCGSSFRLREARHTDTTSGMKSLGKFQLLERLGLGGFGAVWKARDTELDRIVALKIPHTGLLTEDEDMERFQREARAAAQLRHPNIVSVYNVETLNGLPVIVSEFIPGVPLRDLLQVRQLTFRQSAALIAQVAEALDYAHSMGVVHRDIKPANLMLLRVGQAAGLPTETERQVSDLPHDDLTDIGKPMLLDFGLALRDAAETTMTMDGHVLGTPAYMSPEQAAGLGHKADRRSDVYSLGVVLYEFLTGELPFRGSRLMMLQQVLHEEPRPPRKIKDKIPRDLETMCLKCLAKAPAGRYATARALADDLRRYLAGEPILARPVGTAERLVRWCRRKPALASMTGALAAVVLIAFAVVVWQLREVTAAQRQRALAQVNALRDAAPGAVPGILADLEANRATVLPQLRARFSAEQERVKRLRLALALLPVEPELVRRDLATWMLEVNDPAEVLLVRNALKPHAGALAEELWRQVDEPKTPREQRFRALVALATFDAASPRWPLAAPGMVEELLTANPLYLGSWVQALQPVQAALLTPLREVFRGQRLAEQRQVAATVLADYAADQPALLADLIVDADAKQYRTVFAKLSAHSDRAMPPLLAELEKKPAPSKAGKQILKKDGIIAAPTENLASRQANAAVTLLRLNQAEKAWPLLKHSADPSVRSWLIHRLAPLGVDAEAIVKRLDGEPDLTIRRALILSLAEYGDKELSPDARQPLLAKLQSIYRTEADPGLHASSEWLLRTWKQAAWLKQVNDDWVKSKEQREKRLESIKQDLSKASRGALAAGVSPQWYVNGQGQTMVVIPGPVEFMMGSPPGEEGRFDPESLHRKRIGRTFAIAAKPVTVAEYRRFNKSYTFTERYAPAPDCPVVSTSWYQAAAYCNWLSEHEGIPPDQWCYETSPNGQVTNLKEKYLSLVGYRLPTEAEMEFVTRAEAVTSRYYGEAEELLGKYAWFVDNSAERSWPVGTKKPNDLGFFDMHGNVWCWCQERYLAYGQSRADEPIEDSEDILSINNQDSRVLRGGSFYYQASFVRSACRLGRAPTYRSDSGYGLRPSRTLPLASFTALPPIPEGDRRQAEGSTIGID